MEYTNETVKCGYGNASFTVRQRYSIVEFIAYGSQGIVVKATDNETGKKVAIKKFFRLFEGTDQRSQRYAQLAFREFSLLTSLTHPNLIGLLDAYTPQQNPSDFKEIYVVMEYFPFTLREVIRNTSTFCHRDISFIAYQIIAGVHHLHRFNIIHRDLKPENIGCDPEGIVIKIFDYGLARISDPGGDMTSYVVTRPYRAPELALQQTHYDAKVDVWSIACIVAEMATHRLLFGEGKNNLVLWQKIVEIIGTPNESFIQRLSREGQATARGVSYSEGKRMDEIIPDSCLAETDPTHPTMNRETLRNFLENMLKIDPDDRFDLEEAVKHKYVNHWLRNEEWECPQSDIGYDSNNDSLEQPVETWRRLLFDKVKEYEESHKATAQLF